MPTQPKLSYEEEVKELWKDIQATVYCPTCGREMDYQRWPAIDKETGEHLGNYEALHCLTCNKIVDVTEY